MHLGLIIYGSLNTLTGGYIYDRILVDYLRERGHRVEIVSLTPRSYGCYLLDNFSRELSLRLARARYDLLLQDELNHPSLVWTNRVLRRKAIFPIVAIVHQVLCRQPRPAVLNRIYQAIETRYLKSVDAFVFNSHTTRRTVQRLIGSAHPALVAFPAGDRLGSLPAVEAIRARAYDPGPLRLIFVGNVFAHKGLTTLLRALKNLGREIWHLTVVGDLTMDRVYVRRVNALIDALSMRGQIEMVGPRDGEALRLLFSRSHVFVMPDACESFGIAYLEAMAFGLPVIASSRGAVKEFVVQGRNGFLIEPGDLRTVGTHLLNLYQDRERLVEMSKGARQTFQSRPVWRDTMASIEAFLIDLKRSEKNSSQWSIFQS